MKRERERELLRFQKVSKCVRLKTQNEIRYQDAAEKPGFSNAGMRLWLKQRDSMYQPHDTARRDWFLLLLLLVCVFFLFTC